MIPGYIKKTLKALSDAGFESYVVGGAVRDTLRGVPVHDYDVTTSALPDQTKAAMEQAGFKTIIDTSARYGTVVFINPGVPEEKIEITTFRSDNGYSDCRHPDSVRFTASVMEDAARRDFTVNALYMDAEGNITDPNGGGEADIKEGIIRAVGDPVRRFEEDALRILRAVRFEAQTGFTIEENTASAMKKTKELLKNISSERIFSEFTGIVTAANGPMAIRHNLEVISVIIPELLVQDGFDQLSRYHDRDLLTHTLDVLDGVPLGPDGKKDTAIAIAALIHDIGKPAVFTIDENGVGHMKKHSIAGVKIAERIADELKFSNQLKHEVTELVLYHDSFPEPERKAVKVFASIFGFDLLEKLFVLQRADIAAHSPLGLGRMELLGKIMEVYKQIREENPCMSIRQLAISGDDLMEMGYPEGPMIGAILKDVLEKVMLEILPNEPEDIVRYVKGEYLL